MTDFNGLVIQAQQGNQTAMTIVIKHMYKSLYANITKMWKEIPGGHTAEDIIQYAMIEVVRAINSYDGHGYAKNWIWLYVKSEVNLQARYLNYNKRKLNINSDSLDKPLESDGNVTFGHILPCKANTEQDAISNIFISGLIESLREQFSKLESEILNYMMKEYTTKDIIAVTGYPCKTIDNAKERIKRKVRICLAVA